MHRSNSIFPNETMVFATTAVISVTLCLYEHFNFGNLLKLVPRLILYLSAPKSFFGKKLKLKWTKRIRIN
jgi:hypothetical protein